METVHHIRFGKGTLFINDPETKSLVPVGKVEDITLQVIREDSGNMRWLLSSACERVVIEGTGNEERPVGILGPHKSKLST